MIEDDIIVHVIAGIIDAGRRIMGDGAIKAVSDVEGLDVRTNGEIVVTGDCHKIIGELCGAYEKALQSKIVVDLDVRLNLIKR